MKKKFNVYDYVNENGIRYSMHCDSEEKARIFCNYMNKLELPWVINDFYSTIDKWYYYGHLTCFVFLESNVYPNNIEIANDKPIMLEFDSFDWK